MRTAALWVVIGLVALGAGQAKFDGTAWPADRGGLLFVWENSAAPNEILRDGKVLRYCNVQARDHARYGRYFVMQTARGSFVADDEGDSIAKGIGAAGNVSLELVVTPAVGNVRGRAAVMAIASSAADGNLWLEQRGDRLVVRLGGEGGERQVELARLQARRPTHVVVAIGAGKLAAYVDGRQATVIDVPDDVAGWKAHPLTFGDDFTPGANWSGTVEHVAVYGRTLDAEQAAAHFRIVTAKLQERRPASRTVVVAKLLRVGRTPAIEDIAPYARALSAYTYEIESVIQGPIDAKGKRIQVAQWVILDRKTVPVPGTVGEKRRLTLEDFTDHPQLESERLINDSDEFDLPLFCEVEP